MTVDYQWLIDEGLIQSVEGYYETQATEAEIKHAIETAYLAADDEQRKQLVDQAWASGDLQGDMEYWYADRSTEVGDLAGAYSQGSGDASGVSDGTVDYGVAPPGGSSGPGTDLLLPGTPELWFNTTTDEWYVVYTTPSFVLPDGTVYDGTSVSWLVESDEDLNALTGPGNKALPHFSGSQYDFTAKGVVNKGGSDELRDFGGIEGDPFDTWVEDMSILAQTRPWILDDDYVAYAIQAAMERADGVVSMDEIKLTQWWINNPGPKRIWMETVHGDPATAAMLIDNNRINIRTQLAEAGINNASEELINYMADKTTMGDWSLAMVYSQIAALADPFAVDKVAPELARFLGTTPQQTMPLDTTQGKEGTVRDLLQKWLGPVYGNWSAAEVTAKAGELRNDPDAEANFIEYLKDQRMAIYPNYGNREVSYAAAARPWSTYLTGQWGFVPDETDDVFQQIVQANDPSFAGETARRTGFDRGYEKSVNTLVNEIGVGSSSSVIGAT